jgi:gamma-glutamyltranspeptidase/glutathione hydrolase/leukotriene-C4 hydrolase
VTGKKAAVAVEAEQCSNIGVDSKYDQKTSCDTFAHFFVVLKQGGNAVDAAIASTLCIGVIDSFATGTTNYQPNCHKKN